MSLPKPREGLADRFSLFPVKGDALTLGDPEKILWASITQMTAHDLADFILREDHNISNKKSRAIIAKNLKIYLRHASDFYEAGQFSKANSAPLLYYYAFLNLAKGLCEITYPSFHKRSESYRHGLTWRPSPHYLVDMENEYVSLTTRGVWHVLFEAVKGQKCSVANPTKLRIKDLFSLCPGVAIEFGRTYGKENNLVEVVNPEIVYNLDKQVAWIRFSIARGSLRRFGISRQKLTDLVSYKGSTYYQVQSSNADIWTFEFKQPKKIPRRYNGVLIQLLEPEIQKLNLFAHLAYEELEYLLPIQTRFPLAFPQLMILYTIIFWLGSLVRYDPHSFADLQDSHHWLLIDGFMNQSRIWLLELFEWQFYRTETKLLSVR